MFFHPLKAPSMEVDFLSNPCSAYCDKLKVMDYLFFYEYTLKFAYRFCRWCRIKIVVDLTTIAGTEILIHIRIIRILESIISAANCISIIIIVTISLIVIVVIIGVAVKSRRKHV